MTSKEVALELAIKSQHSALTTDEIVSRAKAFEQFIDGEVSERAPALSPSVSRRHGSEALQESVDSAAQ